MNSLGGAYRTELKMSVKKKKFNSNNNNSSNSNNNNSNNNKCESLGHAPSARLPPPPLPSLHPLAP